MEQLVMVKFPSFRALRPDHVPDHQFFVPLRRIVLNWWQADGTIEQKPASYLSDGHLVMRGSVQLNESETALVSRCQAGNTEAFSILVEQHSRVLFGTAYLMTRDRGLAEDAVQAALVKIWKNLPSLRQNSSLKAWLVRIVINEVNQQRRKKRLPTVPLEQAPEVPDEADENETELARAEDHQRLRQALETLTVEQREAVVLRYFSDLTVREVATVASEREGTIKSRLSRALDKLGEILGKDEIFQDRR
jgi:RNA polymerase sigma-70 factor, ECF subfamily